MKPSGLYIHVPFCRHKCLYCDFYSGGARIADWNLYVDALIHEISGRIELEDYIFKPKTLYLGGGTPSLIPAGNLKMLVDRLDSIVDLSDCREFTIEVNPEDVNRENCRNWKEIGVNRVSLGVQSLNDNELKAIGRHHSSEEATVAAELLKNFFHNVSVDIIYGLPGQTKGSLEDTLNRIIVLSPQHISIYSLTIEEGTALDVLVGSGKLTLPDEDDWKEMTELISRKLRDAVFLHYEISNYAKPGFESLHNTGYWNGQPYMGLGPGAHSYDGEKIRRFNPADLKGYLKWGGNKEKRDFFSFETLTEEELIEEAIMTKLRTLQGLDLEGFQLRFGKPKTSIIKKEADQLVKKGLMKKSGSRISITETGLPLSDFIILKLVSAFPDD